MTEAPKETVELGNAFVNTDKDDVRCFFLRTRFS